MLVTFHNVPLKSITSGAFSSLYVLSTSTALIGAAVVDTVVGAELVVSPGHVWLSQGHPSRQFI